MAGEKALYRSTAACKPCRVRKQKCGGERPVCIRCRNIGQECTWAQRQKRGPAKGYTDALEARLKETENILLGILSTIPSGRFTELLSQSMQLFPRSPVVGSDGSLDRVGKTTVAVGKGAVDYWDRFALSTPTGVALWYRDRVVGVDEHRRSTYTWLQDSPTHAERIIPEIPIIDARQYTQAESQQSFVEHEHYKHPNDSVKVGEAPHRQEFRPLEYHDPKGSLNEGELATQQTNDTIHRYQHHGRSGQGVRGTPEQCFVRFLHDPYPRSLDQANTIQNTTAIGEAPQYVNMEPATDRVREFNQQIPEPNPAHPSEGARPEARSRGLGLPLDFQETFLW